MFNLAANELTAGLPKVSVETSSRSAASKDSACVRCQVPQSVSNIHIYTYYEYASLCKIRNEFTQSSETFSYRSSDMYTDVCQSRFWKARHVLWFNMVSRRSYAVEWPILSLVLEIRLVRGRGYIYPWNSTSHILSAYIILWQNRALGTFKRQTADWCASQEVVKGKNFLLQALAIKKGMSVTYCNLVQNSRCLQRD
jgi:hypothetical protein